MIKISIIIPVYNSQCYLIECFDSIINQSFANKNIEVIIVDDCSNDNTQNICKEYIKKNANWKYFRNKKNQGPAISRNLALQESKGQYIAFLDSDDKLYDNNLEELYNNAIATKADIVIARLNAFDNKGEYGYYSDKYINKNIVTNIYKNNNIINCISICSKLYKRKLIKNLKFLENTLHEDNSFSILSMLQAEKISLLKKSLYYRRYRDVKKDSIMQNLNYNTYRDLLKNYKYIIENSDTKKSLTFLHFYMIRKASNNIINHLKKAEFKKGELQLKEFIEFLYSYKYISKIRQYFYLLYFALYYNLAKIYKGVNK